MGERPLWAPWRIEYITDPDVRVLWCPRVAAVNGLGSRTRYFSERDRSGDRLPLRDALFDVDE
jgi:hypothetical protein